ncbi:hypothetical protein SUGI_0350200 [Cryptomeria japonica]|uniref:lycopene beta cyclase, chloroplastic n=1 Tax=Cryptomeria japonica TaxID=3369 RepID=UPI002408ECD8|nr:lycopene beta cyclase, chloroplastic [Cryptomeria japonica]GLJ19414.1 hypothetical protein SUGI_0350200 [Cryptomeria japonica]
MAAIRSSSALNLKSSVARAHDCRTSRKPCKNRTLKKRSVNHNKIAVCRAGLNFCDLVPENKKEVLGFELPRYDTSRHFTVDLVVAGSGPAGLSVAQQVSEAGISVVCIDPSPQTIWPNNYGVWVDELEAIGLVDCLDTIWDDAVVHLDDNRSKFLSRPYGRINRKLLKEKMMGKCISNGVRFHQAKVLNVTHESLRSSVLCDDGVSIQATLVLDATGFSRCLVEYKEAYNPGYQIAYGILAEVDWHPFDLGKMVLMDWRDSHLGNEPVLRAKNEKLPTFLYAMPFDSNRIFLEETSLVSRPAMAMEEIKKRMVARLRYLGIKVKRIEEDERCVIPMGGSLPVIPQRVTGIGGTVGMVHPSTGYMVAKTLATAPIVANSIIQCLGCPRMIRGTNLSASIWNDLWPPEKKTQREFFCFGMDVLLQLDLEGTRGFFDAFFDLDPYQWHGFLSSRLFFPDLIMFGLSLFAHATFTSKLDIVGKGTLPLLKRIDKFVGREGIFFTPTSIKDYV